jgi:hypothetical protein
VAESKREGMRRKRDQKGIKDSQTDEVTKGNSSTFFSANAYIDFFSYQRGVVTVQTCSTLSVFLLFRGAGRPQLRFVLLSTVCSDLSELTARSLKISEFRTRLVKDRLRRMCSVSKLLRAIPCEVIMCLPLPDRIVKKDVKENCPNE